MTKPTVADFSDLICDFFEAVRKDTNLLKQMRGNPAVNEACGAMINALERLHFQAPLRTPLDDPPGNF
jgi:hypothetical protein